MTMESPKQENPAAEMRVEPVENNAIVGISPEQRQELQRLLSIERAKTLLAQQMDRGEFDPSKIDFKDPIQVAAAEQLIKDTTGQKVRYSPEATVAEQQRAVLAQEAASDAVREQEASNRLVRADADAAGETTLLGKEVLVAGNRAPAASIEQFTADVAKQEALDAELAENPQRALRRERLLALTLEGQPEGAQWQVADTKGDEITVFRVDRVAADGTPIQDPMSWKVVRKVIRAEDVRTKYNGRLLN